MLEDGPFPENDLKVPHYQFGEYEKRQLPLTGLRFHDEIELFISRIIAMVPVRRSPSESQNSEDKPL